MAKIREIEVSVGLSIDKKGIWVKGNTRLTVALDDKDDVGECFKRAFQIAEDELETKMSEYLEDGPNE